MAAMSGMGDDALIDELTAVIGHDSVVCEPEILSARNADWRGEYRGRGRALVLPRTVAQVSDTLRICSAANAPVVVQGGRTGLSGAAQPDDSGTAILLSLERLDALRRLDTASMTLCVDAGMTLHEARRHAAGARLCLPILLGSEGSAQIGGVIATNAGGSNALRFGMARSRLLGLEVVMADGRIWNGLRGLTKDNAGYSLTQLFAGSEGTLGVVTAATLQLSPAPTQTVTALAAVDGIQQALNAVAPLRTEFAETLVAAEYMSRDSVDLSCSHRFSSAAARLQGRGAVLLEWATSMQSTEMESRILAALESLMEAGHLVDVVVAKSETERNAFWSLRDTIGPAQGDAGYSVKNDVSVPVSMLGELVARGVEAVAGAVPIAMPVVYGHLGDGNLHFNFSPTSPAQDAELRQAETLIVSLIAEVVEELGGSFSAEHGIGQSKRAMLADRRPAVELDMMRRIKAALDPLGILNPGKVI